MRPSSASINPTYSARSAKISMLSEGRLVRLGLREWLAGPSLGLSNLLGKSKITRRACSSYRPPVRAHAASQYIRSEDERHDENRIKFIPSTAATIQL
jgi:hypothetical protein